MQLKISLKYVVIMALLLMSTGLIILIQTNKRAQVYAGANITTYDKMDYAELRKISMRVPIDKKNPFSTISYEGGKEDLDYLREYIIELATELYDVPSEMFDRPTLASTSILRDLVHKFNYQLSNENSEQRHKKSISGLRKDKGSMWRYKIKGDCGFLSFSLYNIYKALGYKTNRLDSINGWLGSTRKKPIYTKSHVTIEVYLEDYKKFIVQDPTFNFILTDEKGNALSFDESRRRFVLDKKPHIFQSFITASPFILRMKNSIGKPIFLSGADIVLDDAWSFLTLRRETYRYGTDERQRLEKLFKEPETAHEPIIPDEQPNHTQANEAFKSCENITISKCIKKLNRRKYESSGYRFLSAETQEQIAEYLMLHLPNGYVSINYATGDIINGSYDQIFTNIVNGTAESKVDKALFFSPVTFIDYKGRKSEWVF